MMQQRMNNAVPPGLQALMVLKQQSNPMTPQGLPTIAAQTEQQVMQQAMPQQPGPQTIAPNAGVGNAIEMQRQQEAQQAMMQMAQAQQQPQGPLQMAEGGIASLPMGDEDYADGGIVGYAIGGEFDTGEMSSEQLAEDQERIRKLLEVKRRKEQEFIESRAKATAQAFGQEYVPPQSTAAPSAASFKFGPDTPPGAIINALTGELRSNQALSDADRTAIAKEIQSQFVRLGSMPQEQAAPAPTGIAAAMPRPQETEVVKPSFAATARDVGQVFPAPSDTAMRDAYAGLQALQAQRATPDEAIAQLEEARKQQREIYNRQLAQQGSLGELMATLGSISRRGDGLTGLQEYRGERDKAALAQIALDQNLAKEKRLLRDKYLADQIGDKATALKFEEALYKNAEERQKLMAQTTTSVFTTQAGMTNAEVAAQQREEAARIKFLAEQQKTGGRAMTYNEASDNVQNMLDSTTGMMEIMAIRKQAKDAGHPEPSLPEIKEMLIQRELRGAGVVQSGAPAGGQNAPAVGTVMQGYRFKGGNPADKNNWEKV